MTDLRYFFVSSQTKPIFWKEGVIVCDLLKLQLSVLVENIDTYEVHHVLLYLFVSFLVFLLYLMEMLICFLIIVASIMLSRFIGHDLFILDSHDISHHTLLDLFNLSSSTIYNIVNLFSLG